MKQIIGPSFKALISPQGEDSSLGPAALEFPDQHGGMLISAQFAAAQKYSGLIGHHGGKPSVTPQPYRV
jgi:hypothetical protein